MKRPIFYRIILLIVLFFVFARTMKMMALHIKSIWFDDLEKPDFMVDDQGVVWGWGITMCLFSFATALIWERVKDDKMHVLRIAFLYFSVLFLCLIRPIAYMLLESIVSGLLNAFAILLLSLYIYLTYNKINERYAYLVLPFLVWLVYVCAVNATLWLTN